MGDKRLFEYTHDNSTLPTAVSDVASTQDTDSNNPGNEPYSNENPVNVLSSSLATALQILESSRNNSELVPPLDISLTETRERYSVDSPEDELILTSQGRVLSDDGVEKGDPHTFEAFDLDL